MSPDIIKFITKLDDKLGVEEFKLHLTSYLKFPEEKDVLDYINSGGAASVFIDTSPWFKKITHRFIIEIVFNLFNYYVKKKELPFSANQVIANISRDYMDHTILEKTLAISRTWDG